MNKRSVVISIKDGEYNVQFMRADGTMKSEWGYWSMASAEKDIATWLADDSTVKD